MSVIQTLCSRSSERIVETRQGCYARLGIGWRKASVNDSGEFLATELRPAEKGGHFACQLPMFNAGGEPIEGSCDKTDLFHLGWRLGHPAAADCT